MAEDFAKALLYPALVYAALAIIHPLANSPPTSALRTLTLGQGGAAPTRSILVTCLEKIRNMGYKYSYDRNQPACGSSAGAGNESAGDTYPQPGTRAETERNFFI
jgi:hypothetical protein